MAERASRGREPVVASHGAVSAAHPLVAATALRLLADGADVVDAAVAASAVAAVVEPAWCGVGGDAFLLIHRARGETVALNGSGAAPQTLDDQVIGAATVPRFGPLSIAVPGLVGAWRAAARFTTRPLASLLATAIAYAKEGFPVYPRLARAIVALGPVPSPGLAQLLAANGRAVGDAFRQPDLARTLEAIAADPAAFYTGALGRALAEGLAARGARLSREDLATHQTDWVQPLRGSYRGHEVLTQPPVSLGCVLLEALHILERFPLDGLAPGDPRLVELQVGAIAAAFADVDAFAGDPTAVDVPLDHLLSVANAESWRKRIAHGALSSQAVAVSTGPDTTSIVVADAAGNVACLLQSLFNEWGSRELVSGTGVLLNDRLANLPVGGTRPNRLRPGKRPLHTLHGYLALKEGELVLAGATPGGRGQPQTNLQVLSNIIDSGLDVQAAVDRPRWLRGLPRTGPEDATVYLESGFESGVTDHLIAVGHAVQGAPTGGIEPFGSCTVIARQPLTGALLAAADGRRGGAAIGY